MSDEGAGSENAVEAAAESKRLKDAASKAMDRARQVPIATVAGAAIGSAAVVAAMLYFNRKPGKKKSDD